MFFWPHKKVNKKFLLLSKINAKFHTLFRKKKKEVKIYFFFFTGSTTSKLHFSANRFHSYGHYRKSRKKNRIFTKISTTERVIDSVNEPITEWSVILISQPSCQNNRMVWMVNIVHRRTAAWRSGVACSRIQRNFVLKKNMSDNINHISSFDQQLNLERKQSCIVKKDL